MSTGNRWYGWLCGAVALALLLGGTGAAALAADRGQTQAREGENADAEEDLKYQKPTDEQIAAVRKLTEAYAAKTLEFSPKTHLVETDHFLLYSPWDKSADRQLRDICEKLYKALCKQFDIDPKENIWVHKCALYVFDDTAHFERFCKEVDKIGNPKAGGYCAWNSAGMVYIVMNKCPTRDRFYEVLVHEGTHGFISRYRNNRHIPIWVNEGLAELMAATLVPGCYAETNYVHATRAALRDGKDVRGVFDTVRLEAFDYGIAQSFVRFLIARNRKAFPEFFTLLKTEGKTEADALHEAYKLTREDLVRQWAKTAAKGLR